jgi:DNA repair exonuclease SbcCD ATPase subunit
MTFKTIKIQNFLAIGKAEVELENQGFVSVQGVNNTDVAKANGAGKTSILEAVIWGLTGETAKGAKDVKNFYTDGDCKVEIQFTKGDKEYTIRRVKGKELTLVENGIDISGKGITDTQKVIEKIFPEFNVDYLGATVAIAQGMPNAFTNNSGAKRKEILESLTNSDFMIEDIKQRLNSMKEKTQQELRANEDDGLALRVRKQAAEDNIRLLEKKIADSPDDETLTKIISNTAERIAGLERDIKTEMDEANKIDLESIRAEGTRARDELHAAELANQERISKALDVIKSKLAQAETKCMVAKTENKMHSDTVSRLEKEISAAKAVKDTCPMCKQKLPDVHKMDTTELENELESAKETKRTSDAKVNTLTLETQGAQKQLDEAETKLLAESKELLKQFQARVDELLAEWNTQRDIKNKHENQVRELTALRQQEIEMKADYERKLQDNQNKRQENRNNLANWRKEDEGIVQKISGNIITHTNIKDKEKMINQLYSYATKEFRTVLLEDTIAMLDSKAKALCAKVFDTRLIEFKQDGAQIAVSYKCKPLENLSGGEAQCVKLMIQMALRETLEAISGESYSMIWFDEVFDNLDHIMVGKVVDLISELNTESVYIISHHSDLQLPTDRTLTVVKDNDISRVKVG